MGRRGDWEPLVAATQAGPPRRGGPGDGIHFPKVLKKALHLKGLLLPKSCLGIFKTSRGRMPVNGINKLDVFGK